MTLPSLREYPGQVRGLEPRACSRARCFKCSKPTRVEYVGADGRAWPTCLSCAIAANRHPCTVCGDEGPSTHSMESLPAGGHRPAVRHGDGRTCYPLHADERHVVACSNCGVELGMRVIAVTAVIGGGVTDELRCACGAAWRLSATVPGLNVYLGAA